MLSARENGAKRELSASDAKLEQADASATPIAVAFDTDDEQDDDDDDSGGSEADFAGGENDDDESSTASDAVGIGGPMPCGGGGGGGGCGVPVSSRCAPPPPPPGRRTNCGARTFEKMFTLVGGGVLCSDRDLYGLGDLSRAFHKQVMGRSDPEVEASARAAERFFRDEYALDFGDTQWAGGVKSIEGASMFAFQLNPHLRSRIYSVSSAAVGASQPLGSIRVLMGGWMALVDADDGHVFGGRFGARAGCAARRYPCGTAVLFGNYKAQGYREEQFQHTRDRGPLEPPCAEPLIEIVTHIVPDGGAEVFEFSSRSPLVPNASEQLVIDHNIASADGRHRGTSRGVLSVHRPAEAGAARGGSGGLAAAAAAARVPLDNEYVDAPSAIAVSMTEVWTFGDEERRP